LQLHGRVGEKMRKNRKHIIIEGIRKIHRPHRPQTLYTDLLFSDCFSRLGKYTDLLGKYRHHKTEK